MWDALIADGTVEDAETTAYNGGDPVQCVIARVRHYEHIVGSPMRSPTPVTAIVDRDGPTGAAAAARIDALSAVYASWAQHDPAVQAFRRSNLVDRSTAEYRAYVDGHHPRPAHRLVKTDDVQHWVLEQHHAAAADGDGDVRELLARDAPGRPPTMTLAFLAERRVVRLTVDARGVLGELARLADELAERYRWHAAEAAMFVLTGDGAPEVFVYDGSAQIRHGSNAATTRVTMTLDPFLTPDQVAGIYSRLRRRLAPPQQQRSSSIKHYRLAEHVGPRVCSYVDQPSRVRRRGRPPRPGPTGLALYVDPVDGHSWASLRADWNRLHADDPETRTWLYPSDPHFIRDARDILQRLLWPGWDWQQTQEDAGGGQPVQTSPDSSADELGH